MTTWKITTETDPYYCDNCYEVIQPGDDVYHGDTGTACSRECATCLDMENDPPTCPMCGDGAVVFGSMLGNRMHLRCRMCGMDYSRTAPTFTRVRTCLQCHREMNPADHILGAVCHTCCVANHKHAVGVK